MLGVGKVVDYYFRLCSCPYSLRSCHSIFIYCKWSTCCYVLDMVVGLTCYSLIFLLFLLCSECVSWNFLLSKSCLIYPSCCSCMVFIFWLNAYWQSNQSKKVDSFGPTILVMAYNWGPQLGHVHSSVLLTSFFLKSSCNLICNTSGLCGGLPGSFLEWIVFRIFSLALCCLYTSLFTLLQHVPNAHH